MKEFQPDRPIYLQLADEIRKRAARGTYRAGERLPSVRNFARDVGVNPNTASRAYSELEQEGFLVTRRGLGCFVTEDGNRLRMERWRLAEGAREQFIKEVWELELSAEQLDELTQTLREELE